MSYNIDTWRTKELNDLQVPIDAIHKNTDWEIELLENGVLVSGWPEGFEIKGILKNDYVIVSEISFSGEGSGRSWKDILLMLAQSRGTLVASQVWEGGDSISRLTVIDGVVTEEGIDI